MIIDREVRKTFGNISDLYDKARISYPEALIGDIISFSQLGHGRKILDVGCGTGQATFPFATKGFSVVGLDLGKELVQVAQQKCLGLGNVKFLIESFEDVAFPDESFDVLVSGMAWHWINPDVRMEKAHKILQEGGTLALFWSYQRKQDSSFVNAVAEILNHYGGVDRGPAGSRVKQIAEAVYHELLCGDLFRHVEMREYDEVIEFSQERYLNLVLSYGWVQNLPETKRTRLVGDLRELFTDREDPLPIPYKHVLVLAKKN